ncbi:recombinase family protein [uncultured Dokdonia sp.]|uniref:recombinase family protein n=1 Tax=uncultured Dokdonia sp. TaxID=575653 RepID=UPI00262804CE|nr:recombinase family protein [uncultured Dokdonia sp.]
MTKKKIGVWIRVSDPKQVQKDGHVHQEIRARDFVKSRDWEIVKIYRLEAMTGKSVLNYPQTKEMMHDIKTGVISGIVFAKLARLARNTKELIEISEYFMKYDADLISMDMMIDTSSPMGRHIFRQMCSAAEWEREVIVQRVNESIQTRAKLGKSIGGHAPFGYRYNENKMLVIDDKEAPICKLTFELFLKHKRKRTTARMLNDKGYRSRKGNLFSYASVMRMLTDPVYKGLRRMNYSTSNEKGNKIFKPKEEWFFHKVDPIVSVEIWDEVNAIIQKQTKSHIQPLNRRVNLFTRYVFCTCGGKMVTRNSSKNYICMDQCGNRIHKDDLEEIFKSELYNYIVSEQSVEHYFGQLQSVIADKQKQLDVLEKEEKKLNTSIENILNLYNNGQIETDAFKTYHDKPYLRLQQIKEEVQEIQFEISNFSSQKNATQSVFNEAKNLYDKWDSFSLPEKRDIIEIITKDITVSDNEITINLYKLLPDGFAPHSLELTTNGQHNQ